MSITKSIRSVAEAYHKMASEDSQNLAATDAAQAQTKQDPQGQIPDWVPGDLPDDKKKDFMEAVKKAYESDNTQFDFNGRVYKITEKLTGDQDKLDVNNNDKIDSDDLAALRSGKKQANESHFENEVETPGQTEYPGSGMKDTNDNEEIDGEDEAELKEETISTTHARVAGRTAEEASKRATSYGAKDYHLHMIAHHSHAHAAKAHEHAADTSLNSEAEAHHAGGASYHHDEADYHLKAANDLKSVKEGVKNLVKEAIGSKLSPTNVSSNAHAWTANANNNSTFGNHMTAADAHKKAFDYYADKHPDDVKNHGIKRAHHGAMHAYHADMAGHHLDNDLLFTKETNEAFSDAGRQADIDKDWKDLKTRSTADLHKTHQTTLGKIHSKYTPGEVGGKQGMIADILRSRHGHKPVAYYFGLSEHLTGVKEGVTNLVNEGRFDLLQQAIRHGRMLTRSATNNAEFMSDRANRLNTTEAHLAAHHAHLAAHHAHNSAADSIAAHHAPTAAHHEADQMRQDAGSHSIIADRHKKAANALKGVKDGATNQVKEGINNPTDTLTLDVPAMIRSLEKAREDFKSDEDVHNFVQGLLKNKGNTINTNALPKNESTDVDEAYTAIVTRKNSDGSYDEVGMNNRRVMGGSHSNIMKKASDFAKGAHRVELFHGDRISGSPHKVIHMNEGAPADAKGGPEVMDPKTKKMKDDAEKNIKIEDAPYTNKADGSENIVPAEKPTLKKENMDTVKSIKAIADTYRAMNTTAVSEGTAKSSKPSRSSLSAKAWTASEKADETNSSADHDAAFELHAEAAHAHEAHNSNSRLARAHMDQAEYHNGAGE